jgi:hypothetical protein
LSRESCGPPEPPCRRSPSEHSESLDHVPEPLATRPQAI